MFCPKCGSNTFKDTGVSDCEAGDKHVCLSCGAAFWMSEAQSVEVIAEEDPKHVYTPIKSAIEVMLEQASETLREAWAQERSLFAGDYTGEGGKTIKFRRYAPLEAKERI